MKLETPQYHRPLVELRGKWNMKQKFLNKKRASIHVLGGQVDALVIGQMCQAAPYLVMTSFGAMSSWSRSMTRWVVDHRIGRS